LPRLASNWDPPISASKVAGITGICQHTWPSAKILNETLTTWSYQHFASYSFCVSDSRSQILRKFRTSLLVATLWKFTHFSFVLYFNPGVCFVPSNSTVSLKARTSMVFSSGHLGFDQCLMGGAREHLNELRILSPLDLVLNLLKVEWLCASSTAWHLSASSVFMFIC
jgi:hypothetical protein